MEFEEMQVIWNEQKSEKMYAINQDALYELIRKKGKSINSMLTFVELLMMVVNFGVAVSLIADYVVDSANVGTLLTGVAYGVYAVLAVVLRRRRQAQQVNFPHTMMGELERAIWQSNYLIRQGHGLLRWYLIPLALIGGITMALNGRYIMGVFFAIGLPIFTHYAMLWEYRKWHRPKRQELESLRETLVAAERELD